MPFKKTHGLRDVPEYGVWAGMRNRCLNPKVRCYPRYGGRGIKVCERWAKFENFYLDMGPRPLGTSLDRIDVDGDYSPQNCKWATQKEQQNNKRNNRLLTLNGKTQNSTQWAHEVGLPRHVIKQRIKLGWTDCEILTTPKRQCRRKASV